jgi:D-glycero-alpha-D-manno-heptose-7-phosphate kinase
MTIAMNVEAQVINVPTGVQDYRPAYYGGVAAIELRPDGIKRVGIDIDAKELERRLVLVYTGAPHFSGTNNWEITKRHIDGDRQVFDCFERIVAAASGLRTALARQDWDGVAQHLAAEWSARTQLAPGVTTEVIDELIASASSAGARAAKVCGAGGGGCLFCLADPEDVPAVQKALSSRGAALLDFRIETDGLRVESFSTF